MIKAILVAKVAAAIAAPALVVTGFSSGVIPLPSHNVPQSASAAEADDTLTEITSASPSSSSTTAPVQTSVPSASVTSAPVVIPNPTSTETKAISTSVDKVSPVIAIQTEAPILSSKKVPNNNVDSDHSKTPIVVPTSVPTGTPTVPVSTPVESTVLPSKTSTNSPSNVPTNIPTSVATSSPTSIPTSVPTSAPVVSPTSSVPSNAPTWTRIDPVIEPIQPVQATATPTIEPTIGPSSEPYVEPTEDPTTDPTVEPTIEPTVEPTETSTEEPNAEPTTPVVSAEPNAEPTPSTTATEAPVQATPVDITTTNYRVVSNSKGPVEVNQNNGEENPNDGTQLSIAGQTFATGFGTYGNSEIIIPVTGYSTFTTKLGLDDISHSGSVTFEIWNGSTKIVDSGVITSAGQVEPKSLSIDVSGMDEIRLIISNGGDNTDDYADWVDGQLS